MRLWPQINGALLREVLLGQRPGFAAATRQRRLDFRFHREVAAVGMPQEHQAHDRQEVFITGVVGVGAQIIGSAPEACFNGFDVFELRHGGFDFREFAVMSVGHAVCGCALLWPLCQPSLDYSPLYPFEMFGEL